MRAWIAVFAVLSVSQMAVAEETARYKILSDDRFESRRIVAVELTQRERLGDISRIADRLKARDRRAYSRTIVNFYLPNQRLGDGSWATVSYSPHQQTTIRGLSYEEVEAFTAQALEDTRDRIGTWLANSSAIAGAVTIYRDQDKIFVEWTLKNGIVSTDEVTASRVWRGHRYNIKSGARTHFLVSHDNDLEIRDENGLVATAEAIILNEQQRQKRALARAREQERRAAERHAVLQQYAPKSEDAALSSSTASSNYNADGGADIQNFVYNGLEDESVPTTADTPHRTDRPSKKRHLQKRARRTTNDVFMENLLR